MKDSKVRSSLAIIVIYLAAIIGSYFLFKVLPWDNSTAERVLGKIFICDAAATVFVFIFSLIFDNSSIYDPYWSVAPVIMSIGFMKAVNNYNVYSIILLILILIWSIRLTTNCAYWFQNLRHQDWRYQMYKEKHPKLYWLISFFGFHLFPTIIVFVAMIPAFFFFANVGSSQDYIPTAMTIVAYAVILTAIVIELIADVQMIKFKNYPSNNGLVLQTGLWKNSRHPNYFGECLFWFGIFLVYFSFPSANIILMFSPLLVFLMFEFISIPMMDKRQLESKSAYKEYKEHTNALLPIFPPKNNIEK